MKLWQFAAMALPLTFGCQSADTISDGAGSSGEAPTSAASAVTQVTFDVTGMK